MKYILFFLLLPLTCAASDTGKELNAIIKDHSPEQIGGVILATKNGKNILSKTFGLANTEYKVRNTLDTPFQISSLAKQFTAFAILLLESQGKLQLDEPINKYLPMHPKLDKTITIQHLLNHTSGLRESTHLWEMSGGRHDDHITQANLLKLLYKQQVLNFPPGSQWQYSNSGYILLAEIIQSISNTPYPIWVQKNIFSPLKMNSTTVYDRSGKTILKRAYSYYSNGDRAVQNSTSLGDGNLFSTANDLAKWLHNLTTGKVGGSKLVSKMRQKGLLNSGEPISYGFGVFNQYYGELKRIFHGGASGGFNSAMSFYPKVGGGVIVLSNIEGTHVKAINNRVSELVFNQKMEKPYQQKMDYKGMFNFKKSTPSKIKNLSHQHYLGCFYSTELDTTYRTTSKNDTLYLSQLRHGTTVLAPISQDVFTMDVYEWFQGELQFKKVKNKITGLFFSNSRTRKLWFNKVECQS